MSAVPENAQNPELASSALRPGLLLGWALPLLLAVCALSALELLLASWAVVSVASTLGGLLSSFLSSARIFLLVLLPALVVIAHLGSVLAPRLSLIRVEALLAVPLAMGTGLSSGEILRRTVLVQELDFPETELGLSALVAFVSLALSLFIYVSSKSLLQRVVRWLPGTLTPRRVLGALLIGTGALLLVVGHVIFARVHLVTLAGASGVLAALVLLIGIRLLLNPDRVRLPGTSALLIIGLLLSLVIDRNVQGRLYLYSAASTTAPLASLFRGLVDIDGDGASPLWLGGADCAEGDASRGPGMLEIVGDGIDQDCRGGDASPSPSPLPSTPAPAFTDCKTPGGKSVLLITIDAMRADALREELMPHLYRFSTQTINYERAYAPSTMTKPSMGSIMTGLPVATLYRDNILQSKNARFEQTIAESASQSRLQTMSLNWYALDESVRSGFATKNPGIFDIQPYKGQLLAAAVTNSAIRFLSETQDRFLAWVHYQDAHAPYILTDQAPLVYPVSASTAYERGLEYIDHHLGRMLRHLKRSGALAHTVVVITADHGEDRGDRGRLGHGPHLFEDATNVPLLLFVPGCSARTVQEPVSLTWLAPTLTDLADLEFQVRAGTLDTEATAGQPVLVDEPPLNLLAAKRAMILGSLKLIVDIQNGGRALFDLKADPQETRNLYKKGSQQSLRMEAAYQEWLDTVPARR